MPDTAKPSPPADTPPQLPHRDPAFASRVQAMLQGEARPALDAAQPLVEDLRGVLAEQDELRGKLQKLSEAAQQAQAATLHAQGRIDALMQVLHRLETTKAG